jgi:hypothetical protein
VDTDLVLVIGLVVAALTFPAIVSAFSRGSPPRGAAVAAAIGGAMIVVAVTQNPAGYKLSDVPQIVARVVDRYLD